MIRIDRRAHAVWAFCFATLPSLALAAESDEAGARALFAEGRKLADAGKYAEACPKFEQSFLFNPGIGTNFNLADCLEHIGRTASAWTRFLDVAAATRLAGQVERERAARARAMALEPKLARLIIEVASPVPDLVVARDGVVVRSPSWGISVPVDPGSHLVEATAPGKEKWTQSTIVPNAPTTISLLVPELAALPPTEPPSTAQVLAVTPAQPSIALSLSAEPVRPSSIPAVAVGAFGAVALATSALFALKVQSENGEAKVLCPTNTCRSVDEKTRHDTLVSDAHSDRTMALIGVGIGGAAFLTAAYLWWRPARAPSAKSSAGRLSARPLALGAAYGGRLDVDW